MERPDSEILLSQVNVLISHIPNYNYRKQKKYKRSLKSLEKMKRLLEEGKMEKLFKKEAEFDDE